MSVFVQKGFILYLKHRAEHVRYTQLHNSILHFVHTTKKTHYNVHLVAVSELSVISHDLIQHWEFSQLSFFHFECSILIFIKSAGKKE